MGMTPVKVPPEAESLMKRFMALVGLPAIHTGDLRVGYSGGTIASIDCTSKFRCEPGHALAPNEKLAHTANVMK